VRVVHVVLARELGVAVIDDEVSHGIIGCLPGARRARGARNRNDVITVRLHSEIDGAIKGWWDESVVVIVFSRVYLIVPSLDVAFVLSEVSNIIVVEA
jgi:hypothetical protein